MKRFALSLTFALALITVDANAQKTTYKKSRPSAKRKVVRTADYVAESRDDRAQQVQYNAYDSYDAGGGSCGGGGDCFGNKKPFCCGGTFSKPLFGGCGGGCGGGMSFHGGCGGGCGGCGGGCDIASKFGGGCGCSMGCPTMLPYPRCFSFHSPCVGRGSMNPCCGTIFSEMWCDVQNWLSSMAAIPSACCSGACPSAPIGFRGGCGGGVPKICFQDLLAPKCRGGCSGGGCSTCTKPSMLSGFAGMAAQSIGGCTGGCSGSSCTSSYFDGGYADGDVIYGGVASSKGSSSHRYYATTRPGSERAEYVAANEYRLIEKQRVDQREMLARQKKASKVRTAERPSRGKAPRSARRPVNPQSRNSVRSARRYREVETVRFDRDRR